MAEKIALKIYTPEKTALDKKVYRVVLPYGKINLTVIEDRAPTSFLLHSGIMQILNEQDKAVETYFIDGGVVDVADNVCKISTLRLIKDDEISLEQAQEMVESSPQTADFYRMVAAYKKNFKEV